MEPRIDALPPAPVDARPSPGRSEPVAKALGLAGFALQIAWLAYAVVEGIDCSFHPPCHEGIMRGIAIASALPYGVSGLLFLMGHELRRGCTVGLLGVTSAALLATNDSTRVVVVALIAAGGVISGLVFAGWMAPHEAMSRPRETRSPG